MNYRVYTCLKGHTVLSLRGDGECSECGSPLAEQKQKSWRDRAKELMSNG